MKKIIDHPVRPRPRTRFHLSETIVQALEFTVIAVGQTRIDIDLRGYRGEFRVNLLPRGFQMERANLEHTVYLRAGMKFDWIY